MARLWHEGAQLRAPLALLRALLRLAVHLLEHDAEELLALEGVVPPAANPHRGGSYTQRKQKGMIIECITEGVYALFTT